jgi:hypothetical protein
MKPLSVLRLQWPSIARHLTLVIWIRLKPLRSLKAIVSLIASFYLTQSEVPLDTKTKRTGRLTLQLDEIHCLLAPNLTNNGSG